MTEFEGNNILQQVQDAIERCKADGLPVILPTLFREFFSHGPLHPDDIDLSQIVTPSKLYDYILSNLEHIDITLYFPQIVKILTVEPHRQDVPMMLIEELGYLVFEELPLLRKMLEQSLSNNYFRILDICERGIVGEITIANHAHYVLKYANSDQEPEVARQLGELNISPRVIEHTETIILEEFIDFPNLEQHAVDPVFVGKVLGEIIGSMHMQGIVYDNTFRAHIKVQRVLFKSPKVRIIDLENARHISTNHWEEFKVDWEAGQQFLDTLYDDPVVRLLTLLPYWKLKNAVMKHYRPNE